MALQRTTATASARWASSARWALTFACGVTVGLFASRSETGVQYNLHKKQPEDATKSIGSAYAAVPSPAEDAVLPSLESLVGASGSDKARKGNGKGYHGYTRYYERIFEPFRNDPVRIVEIGVERGRSLRVWQEYFARADHVYGIGYGNFQETPSQACATDAATRVATRTNCTLYMGDQSDAKFLRHFVAETGGDFDVVIDDGSHVPAHQLLSFETLWPSVKPGGVYVVEDLETNWWKPTASIYGYSLANQTNVVEKWKGLIDTVNREFTGGRSRLTDENAAVYGSIVSVEFGQNILFVYKALKGEEELLAKPYRFRTRLP